MADELVCLRMRVKAGQTNAQALADELASKSGQALRFPLTVCTYRGPYVFKTPADIWTHSVQAASGAWLVKYEP